jgi:hypothetical protein
MFDWLGLFLAPQSIRPENPLRPLALILDGRFWEYQHEAPERGWPSLGSGAHEKGSIEVEFLQGLNQHLLTDEDPLPQYRRVAESRRSPGPLKTLTAVLEAIVLADNGRQEAAIGILLQRDTKLKPGLERALLRLHLAMRYAEVGDMSRALAVNDTVISILSRYSQEVEANKALNLVAGANRWRYSAALRQMLPPPNSLLESAWLSRIDALRADGLQRNLFDQFEGAVADATVHTVSWQSEDQVEASLRRALLRAECFAAWDVLTDVRRELGRYRLLALVAAPARQPDSGFHLLRRAGDEDGLRRAARLYLQLGPLSPLARVGAEFVALETWPPGEVRPIAALLAVSAQVLDSNTVAAALNRVSALIRATDTTRIEWAVTDALLVAAANLAQVASDRQQTELARSILTLVGRPHLEPLVARLRDCLGTIQWNIVEMEVRDMFSQTAVRLAEEPSSSSLGLTLCQALARTDPHCAEVLQRAFRLRPTLELGAMLIGAGVSLAEHDNLRLAQACDVRMKEISAAAFTHQFHLYSVDAAVIMAVLATSNVNTPESWESLSTFLVDPNIPAEMKAAALQVLTERIDKAPLSVRSALELVTLSVLSQRTTEPSFFDSPLAARGAFLRFALAAGIVSPADALIHLLALASDADPRGRIEAAESLGSAIGVKPDLAVITLAVSLTQDQNHQVRAAAGRALAELSWVEAGPLRGVVRERLRALLKESGALVPRATAEGILQAALKGTKPEPTVVDTLRAIARTHPARAVRNAASEALDLMN